MRLFLRDAEVVGRRVDVVVSDCETTMLDGAYISQAGDKTLEVNARGGALLPGLHDHHLHLLAMAVASINCHGARSLADLGTRLRQAPGTWIRATGYHESLGGELDRHVLDRLVPDRPVRVKHRSGSLWFLNSLALQEVRTTIDTSDDVERDPDGEPNGRLWHYDSRLRVALPPIEPDLAAVGDKLLRLGVTGVTDATPDLNPFAIALLHDARLTRALPQDLMLLGAPDDFIDTAEMTTVAAWTAATSAGHTTCGEPDPWAAMRAAAGPDGTASPQTILDDYLSAATAPGRPPALHVGRRGGLCLMRKPQAEVLAAPDAELVHLVATRGRITSMTPTDRTM